MLNNIFQWVGGILDSIFGPAFPGGHPGFPGDCDENEAIRRRLLRYLNQNVTVETVSGEVSGLVTAVGADYLELQSAGEIILIPFESIIYVDAQGGVS
ncbi:DUF2642 domain-containing protein [Kroppenstedtia sanguinis]|uniref:DUF2642 domain-containing protein n=1 Tax=Kroppenstedtia sanguinis TaxID=1380684 RepID=A0ABW4C9X5_9BACL